MEGGGGSSASELPDDSWADGVRAVSASKGQAAAAASDAGGGSALRRLDATWRARADALATRWGVVPGNLFALVEAAGLRQSADSLVEEENEVIAHVFAFIVGLGRSHGAFS